MASAGSDYNFECPECDEELTVSHKQTGSQIPCSHCGETVHVPNPMSTVEKLLVGMIEEDEIDHPGTLKIDGIDGPEEDGTSWHIKCHICDSVLLVTNEQVGMKVKCNDCYSMLVVKSQTRLQKIKGVADGSDLEIVEDEAKIAPPKKSNRQSKRDEADELTLMPAVDLAPEVTDFQKESFIDDLDEDEPLAELTELTEAHLEEVEEEPVGNPMFRSAAPASSEFDDDDDDSDEMIEILDVSPEELNQTEVAIHPGSTLAPPPASAQKEMARVPRKGKQPDAIPVPGEDDDAPVRVHAKRRPKKKKKSKGSASAPQVSNRFQFDEATPSEFLEKSMEVLKSGKVWIWTVFSIALMATGGAVWQWLGPHRLDKEATELSTKFYYWAAGLTFGQLVFFAGYIILLFVGGVIFRETAQGKTKVESVSTTDGSDFTSTMLLFGFSMFIAALPCLFFYMFIALPIQFFLAGIFLFAAWKNQAAFQIVSGSIVQSFSEHGSSWKNWAIGAGIAAVGAIVGGGLMEIPFQVISVFTSIAGAILVAFTTLFYAAITGWHCGTVVEKLSVDE